MSQLCTDVSLSGHGRRVADLPIVGALLCPTRPREKPEGWLIVEAWSARDREALSALVRRFVRVRTRLTNGIVQLTWITHVRTADDSYAGTSRLCLRGRAMPALVIVGAR